jgi:hypothetical protein
MERAKRLLQIAEWILFACIPFLAAIRSVNPDTYTNPLSKEILKFLSNWPLSVILWVSIIGLVVKIANQEIFGKLITSRNEVKKILDSLHEIVFKDVDESQWFKHRVTLFKAYKPFLRKARSLKIFARSGTAYSGSKSSFKIDDTKAETNEGIAGQAWFINAQLTVTDLPEWPEQQTPIRFEYAQKGFLPMDKAAQLELKSRSITATVVRNREGKKWGVLVVDSPDPQGITDSSGKTALARLGAEFLTRML